MVKLKHLISDRDIFGYDIHLNFNGKGYTKRTIIGGLFSIVIKAFMIMYVGFNVKKMFWKEDDRIYKFAAELNTEEKPLKISSQDVTLFHYFTM